MKWKVYFCVYYTALGVHGHLCIEEVVCTARQNRFGIFKLDLCLVVWAVLKACFFESRASLHFTWVTGMTSGWAVKDLSGASLEHMCGIYADLCALCPALKFIRIAQAMYFSSKCEVTLCAIPSKGQSVGAWQTWSWALEALPSACAEISSRWNFTGSASEQRDPWAVRALGWMCAAVVSTNWILVG